MEYLNESPKTEELAANPDDLHQDARLGETELRDEVILAASINNPKHYELLVDRYQAAFTRNARKVLGDREEVHDAVQETFTKIYMNAHKFEKVEGAKFSSWAYKILFNTTFTYYKKLKKVDGANVALDDEIWALMPDTTMSDLEKRELRDLVASGLSRMPESLARILSMHFLEDLPQKEIAKREGITISAVKTRIHRAKKEFKKTGLGII